MSSTRPLTVLVCTGGDCRRSKGHDQLMVLAASASGSATAPCQGICDGPVAGVVKNGEVRWYRELRGRKLRVLAQLLRTNGRRRPLKPYEVRKRRNKIRRRERLRPITP